MTSSQLPVRATLITLAVLACGSAAYTLHPVHAQSRSHNTDAQAEDQLAFQLSEVGPHTGLTVYNSSQHTLYVYQNVSEGNSHINCAYALTITKPGLPVERHNCAIGSAY